MRNMYRYDSYDQTLVNERVTQFRDQTRRFLAGELSDDAFKPLRLQNGLYLQRHAPMLRVAIPYGLLASRQLRTLAHIARTYDKGYGHFTTRQNIQFNWPELAAVPDILEALAGVEMHAIQTSGNCIRNVTSDAYAGVAADEIVDPRPWAELIRQWSTFHPEFAYLPRKFKIAVNGAAQDRAGIRFHDIGVEARRDQANEVYFRIFVGGGLGRTPILGHVIHEHLEWPDLLTYLESILRVYNRLGRRDNAYKARVKITVKEMGLEAFRAQVEHEFALVRGGAQTLSASEVARVSHHFVDPSYQPFTDVSFVGAEVPFKRWLTRNVKPHKQPGYASVVLSLKPTGVPPGDVTADQMDAIADLADRFSLGELRVTHEQNLVLADVAQTDLHSVWEHAKRLGLATPNIGLLTDIVACPGGDYCSLANAVSIPIANAIQDRFADLDYLHDLGDLELNISGCMNSCAQHHVAHIGVLGVDKHGEEFYQVSIGGQQGDHAALGRVIGPAFARDEMPDVIEWLVNTYVDARHDGERFIDTLARLGHKPFVDAVYSARNAVKQEATHALDD